MSVDNPITVPDQCDRIITEHSLLRHPFYVAWSEGTLPVAALKDYAGEYGAFIGAIGQGWQTIGAPAHARVEAEHARVWERAFAAPLGTSVTTPQVREVVELVDASRELFAERATALGALYAFEAQQPLTAQSKLKGLSERYSQLPESCGEYFRMHLDDYDELSLLAREMDGLNPADQERALSACERMSRALYDALTGIHAPHTNQGCNLMTPPGN